jgi:glycopeptide antibiotics resistance protein
MQPDILSKLFRARTLLVLSALFIVYATSIPWDFEHAPSLARAQWIPFWDPERGRPPSISDLVQNVVLFLPLGFFAVLGIARIRRGPSIAGIVKVGLIGGGLSFLVECLQTMSMTRTPSASDLAANTAGALAGAVGAFVWARVFEERFRRTLEDVSRRQPGLIILFAFVVAVLLGGLAPFIPTLDVSDLRANMRRLLDHPWGEKPVGALASDLLLFSAIAFLAAHELPPLVNAERMKAAIAFAATSALAIAIEIAQLFIIDHSPGVQDAAAAILGAALGASAAAVLSMGDPRPVPALGDLTRRSPVLVVGFALLAPALRALSPFVLAPIEEKLADISGWNFLPFWPLFRNVNLATFRNVFEAAMYYVPLGYALSALGKRPLTAVLVALGTAEALEVLQIPIEGRTFDITEGLYAGFAAFVGAYALSRLTRFQVASSGPRHA